MYLFFVPDCDGLMGMPLDLDEEIGLSCMYIFLTFILPCVGCSLYLAHLLR
jgi:hypothetical protein